MAEVRDIRGFSYSMFNNNVVTPSIEAGYGPYESLQQAITEINKLFNEDFDTANEQGYNITGYAPPLGLKFGVQANNTLTEYQYKHNINGLGFTIENTTGNNPGIVVIGTGGSGTVMGVVKGVKNGSNNESLVDSGDNKAYIPMATSTVDGLLSKEDKSKLNKLTSTFIEVLEPGIYNVDANFEVEPVATSSTTGGDLEDKVNKIIGILGSLYSDNATFIVE